VDGRPGSQRRLSFEVVDLLESIPRICRDPADDQLVACAVAGGVDPIVSGDRDLLALRQVGKIPILSANQFLDLLGHAEGGGL
jgi:uncharacterized protein